MVVLGPTTTFAIRLAGALNRRPLTNTSRKMNQASSRCGLRTVIRTAFMNRRRSSSIRAPTSDQGEASILSESAAVSFILDRLDVLASINRDDAMTEPFHIVLEVRTHDYRHACGTRLLEHIGKILLGRLIQSRDGLVEKKDRSAN